MNPTRRTFLKTTLVASATAALSLRAADRTGSPGAPREFYELRAYRLKSGASTAQLDHYLEAALLPALGKRGLGPVGAFTELEVDKKAGTSKPKVGTAEAPAVLWLLITHPNLDSFIGVAADLNNDTAVQAAGRDYLLTPKASPAYTRVDSWLLRAFAGMPKLAVPAFSKTKVATRVFEMRDYESHSEERALNKMAMFDDGEIEVMRDLGMAPLFFGQAVAGPNLPHLRYITCAPDLTSHLANWKKFGPDPRWVKMKEEPRYKDNTSKNTARFLVPTPYSQL